MRFEFKPASRQEFVGAKIEGSNVSRIEGYVTLAEIKDATQDGEWGEVRFENARNCDQRHTFFKSK